MDHRAKGNDETPCQCNSSSAKTQQSNQLKEKENFYSMVLTVVLVHSITKVFQETDAQLSCI